MEPVGLGTLPSPSPSPACNTLQCCTLHTYMHRESGEEKRGAPKPRGPPDTVAFRVAEEGNPRRAAPLEVVDGIAACRASQELTTDCCPRTSSIKVPQGGVLLQPAK